MKRGAADVLVGLMVALLSACGDSGSSTPRFAFEAFAYEDREPDVQRERLCPDSADPEAATDFVFIECAIEGGRFAPAAASAAGGELTVLAYNIERGFEVDAQIELLRDGPSVPLPDVMLLSEVDRGCARTQHRNIARDYARALDMNYVYGVEFVELPTVPGGPTCEHGNAVLSRFPIGNVRLIRHADNDSWYIPPDERAGGGEARLGGRMALRADLQIGRDLLRVTSVHFESRVLPFTRKIHQATETAEDGLAVPYPAVIGGDTNAPFYFLDIAGGSTDDGTTQAFFERGYEDPHAGGALSERITHEPFLILDVLFVSGAEIVDAGLCPLALCREFSDHSPIWTSIRL